MEANGFANSAVEALIARHETRRLEAIAKLYLYLVSDAVPVNDTILDEIENLIVDVAKATYILDAIDIVDEEYQITSQPHPG